MSFQTQYPDQPVFDIHTHHGRRLTDDGFASTLSVFESVRAACGKQIAGCIDLDGGLMRQWVQDVPGGLARIERLGNGQILPTISDARPLQSLRAASPDEIASRAAQVCGWKWHCDPVFNGGTRAEHGLYDDHYFTPYYSAMERAGMPLLCLHFGAPYGDVAKQRTALLRVMERHPDLIVIQAHFGASRWGDLDDHAAVFDAHPNFYRDISTTAQHVAYLWPTDEVREFFIRYADRLLYATDMIHEHKTGGKLYPARHAKKYALQFEWLETSNRVPTDGIGKRGPRTPDFVDGLNLPKDVLDSIYWRNAARLIPRVAQCLKDQGFPIDPPIVGKPDAPTARATRLMEFLPKVQPRDMASMSRDQRAAVSSDLSRLQSLVEV